MTQQKAVWVTKMEVGFVRLLGDKLEKTEQQINLNLLTLKNKWSSISRSKNIFNEQTHVCDVTKTRPHHDTV